MSPLFCFGNVTEGTVRHWRRVPFHKNNTGSAAETCIKYLNYYSQSVERSHRLNLVSNVLFLSGEPGSKLDSETSYLYRIFLAFPRALQATFLTVLEAGRRFLPRPSLPNISLDTIKLKYRHKTTLTAWSCVARTLDRDVSPDRGMQAYVATSHVSVLRCRVYTSLTMDRSAVQGVLVNV